MRNLARNLATVVLILGTNLPCALAQISSVVNSPHNLSATGPGTIRATSEQQVCIFCHTPHNATPVQPLWNRQTPVNAYIPYTSSSMQAQPGQPTGTSKLCLSCHDGTIALGSVVSRNQPIAMAGGMTTLPPGHRANLGTDLSDDHPISFRYDHTLSTKDPKLRDPGSLPQTVRLDVREEMQCTTCHEAHNNQFGKFLVMNNTNSQLCNSCHNQGTTEIASHTQCASCHQQHTAPSGAYLLRGANVRDACARCHSGMPQAPDAPQGKNVMTALISMSNHDHPGPIDPTKIVTSQADCNSCHDSHTMGRGTAAAPVIPPTLGAVAGVNAAGAVIPRASFEYEVCYKCHSGPTSGSGQQTLVSRQVVQTDTRLEFSPSAISFHPVQAPGKSLDVRSLVPGLTSASMIYCSDCHASDNIAVRGPHGSNVSPILAAEYDRLDNIAESPAAYALCYKCHERSSILANESFSGHSRHIVDNKTACSVCHDPHGIPSAQANAVNHAHLINFDIRVVQRDRVSGRLEYQSMGDRAGTCYLTCHGVDHSPKSYPAAGAAAPARRSDGSFHQREGERMNKDNSTERIRPPPAAPDRREFLKHLGCLTAAGTGVLAAGNALASETGHHHNGPADPMGVLVDLDACIGCRQCEHACKESNGIEAGALKDYEDTSVFATQRRPAPDAFTVVNSYQRDHGAPVYAKVNCVHCNDPACVSACIVGALRKQENGAVVYDAWKCIGCRYCMVACPFQLPAYQYELALTPQVRKCQFCRERLDRAEKPACVAACPREALTFGKRNELIPLAHDKIEKHPNRYVHHVYGEHEVGGTSWLYVSPVTFEQAGFLKVGDTPPPRLTEAIQHGVFKHWIAPLGWYSFLCTMFWWTGRRKHISHADHDANALTTGDGKDGARPVTTRCTSAKELSPHRSHPNFAPQPVKFFTPGVAALVAIVVIGALFWLYRMAVGLAASTNLDQQRPWGLWIAMDVGSGIALAAGGFVSAAIFHVFHRHRYQALERSALITALLGYTFYVPGLLADLGKWWKLPITMLPTCWQGNSVLFEVGMCVMIYLTVQYAELTPIVCDRLLGEPRMARWPRAQGMIALVQRALKLALPALLCMGVALSTFHQSSLGNLLVIAPYKLHPLWWSPWSPLFFLLSAIVVALPMVIFTILFASWALNREAEMDALTPLARGYVPVFIAIYVIAKLADMIWRGTWVLLGSYEGALWLAEMLLITVPLAVFLSPRASRKPGILGAACLMTILGIVLNRLNVFVLAFHPPYQQKPYFPSLTEFMVSAGLVAALLVVYRAMVTYLPILEPRPKVVS